MTTTLTAEDFKNAYEFYDVCTECKKESYKTQVIVIKEKSIPLSTLWENKLLVEVKPLVSREVLLRDF